MSKHNYENKRNPVASALAGFRGGFHKDRRAPRGGAKNEFANLLLEAEADAFFSEEEEDLPEFNAEKL